MHIIPVFCLNKEIVNILIISTTADDKSGRGSRKNTFNRSVVTIVEIKENVKVTVNKVLDLNHVGFTAPSELLLAEIIRGKLLQTIKRHIFLINIADKMHHLSTLLKLCENPEDGLVGILICDFANNADRIGFFQSAHFSALIGFLCRDMLFQEVLLYFVKHKNGFTDEMAKIQKIH